MRKLLILLSALPIFITALAAHLMGLRVLHRGGRLSLTLEELVGKCQTLGIPAEFNKWSWVGMALDRKGTAMIPAKMKSSQSVPLVARELLKLGMAEIWKSHSKLVKWRMSMIKAGYILPPLTVVACVMGTIVGRLPAMWSIAIVGLVIAVCCVMLWLSRSVEKEAAEAIIVRIEKRRMLSRLSEEEALVSAIRAWTWLSLLPGMAIPLMLKTNPK